MADKPETTSRVKVWAGRISNASPHMLPLGAAVEQTNCRCQTEGQLDVRPGLRKCTWTNAIADTVHELIVLYAVPGDLSDLVLMEDSNGNLKVGKGPTLF